MSCLSKIGHLIRIIKELSEKKFSGWVKINFHKGDLSNKIEKASFDELE